MYTPFVHKNAGVKRRGGEACLAPLLFSGRLRSFRVVR